MLHQFSMTSHTIRAKVLAGYVDAIGFVTLGGFFVSFMIGNSTQLGIGIVHHSSDAAIAAGMIATFVIGVILGSLVGRVAGMHRRPAVLSVVALLLGLAATVDAAGR